MFYGADKNTFRKASMLRSDETEAEKLLWQRLNKNQLCGVRFKRQHPISDYVADFYCHKAKLVIEVDEKYHNNSKQRTSDEDRSRIMNELGLYVLRFSDDEIFKNIDSVIEVIEKYLLLKNEQV